MYVCDLILGGSVGGRDCFLRRASRLVVMFGILEEKKERKNQMVAFFVVFLGIDNVCTR